MSIVKRVTLVAAALLLVTMTATAANNAEQVIFSTPGWLMTLQGNSTGQTQTPFGFWIWCAAGAAPNGQGGYQNANACQGSMYFYELDAHATSVLGQVGEPQSGIYVMHVLEGTFPELRNGTIFANADYACTLSNATPDPNGPGNEVDVDCSFSAALGGGTGHAAVLNAVANVTGP